MSWLEHHPLALYSVPLSSTTYIEKTLSTTDLESHSPSPFLIFFPWSWLLSYACRSSSIWSFNATKVLGTRLDLSRGGFHDDLFRFRLGFLIFGMDGPPG
jgi:hypothetical protein